MAAIPVVVVVAVPPDRVVLNARHMVMVETVADSSMVAKLITEPQGKQLRFWQPCC
jgi:hypothetical protein